MLSENKIKVVCCSLNESSANNMELGGWKERREKFSNKNPMDVVNKRSFGGRERQAAFRLMKKVFVPIDVCLLH